MGQRSISTTLWAIGVALIVIFIHGTSAGIEAAGQTNALAVHVLMSNGLKAPMESVRAQAEKAIGRPLIIDYDASLQLKPKIQAGEQFDVALLTPAALDDLAGKGKIVAGSRVDVARVPVAIGQRGDAPKADIGTLDALKHTFLSAKAIQYVSDGASVPAIMKMFDYFGIASQMKAKTTFGYEPATLAPGETQLCISLASEILPRKDLVYLGTLPPQFQIPVTMSAGLSANSRNPEAARAFIQFIRGPEIEPALKANGMQR